MSKSKSKFKFKCWPHVVVSVQAMFVPVYAPMSIISTDAVLLSAPPGTSVLGDRRGADENANYLVTNYEGRTGYRNHQANNRVL